MRRLIAIAGLVLVCLGIGVSMPSHDIGVVLAGIALMWCGLGCLVLSITGAV